MPIHTLPLEGGGELSETPVSRHERHIFVRKYQCQPLAIIAVRFDPYFRTLRGPGPASLGAAANRGEQL